MNQQGFTPILAAILLVTIGIGGVLIFLQYNKSKNLSEFPISTYIATDSSDLVTSSLESSISAKNDIEFVEVEISNKSEKQYWEKVYQGEIIRDVSAFTVPRPASESAQTIPENIHPHSNQKGKLDLKEIVPEIASSSGYSDNVFFNDHIQLISYKNGPGDKTSHATVYLEYLERIDYPVDILLVYAINIQNLKPNTRYQLMLCQYTIDCYSEISTKQEESDQFQNRFFMTDAHGNAKFKGTFPYNTLADRLIVVEYDKKYDFKSVECGSVKYPCLIAGLPMLVLTVHPVSFLERNIYRRAYVQDPGNLKKAIKNKYLSSYQDISYQESNYSKPVYGKDLKKLLLKYEGEEKVTVLEATSCEAGLSVFVDKEYGDLLGYKFIKC